MTARFFTNIARRKTLCCLGMAAFVLILRVILLPVWPIPRPAIYDEFSYLLAADTFAHGHLTNPTHPLWQFFESIYILQHPTYMAKYPPAQGLFMAAGQVLFGHPWFGVWLSCGLLAAAFCWALQGWLPPRWALAGAAIGFQVCFFGYWMNSYWGGAVSALGGALVIGAWPRITRRNHFGYAWVLGLGAVIVMLARPFEGALLMVPVLACLLRQTRLWHTGKAAVWGPIVVCALAGSAWLGFYQYRVTGNSLRMPYREYQSQYEAVPQFNILPVEAPGKIKYRHVDLEWVDQGWLLNAYRKARSPQFLPARLHDWHLTLQTVLGSAFFMIPLLGFLPRLWRSRKTRFLAGLAAVMVVGSFLEVPQYPHYSSPFAAVFLILCVQGLRHLRGYAPLFIGVVLAGVLFTDAKLIATTTTPDHFLAAVWKKWPMEAMLAQQAPGRHLIFVRYTRYLEPHAEWIYNLSSIDSQAVIWAQDMGGEANRRLMQYYPGRAFWRFEPDESSDALLPY